LANAELERIEGDAQVFIGVDASGLEIEIVVVPDNRRPGELAVIHAMPRRWRTRW
jgi:hypothetical protein